MENINQEILRTLVPNRLQFEVLNPIRDEYLHTDHLCVAVLDSVESEFAASMIVPDGLETDWLFSTEQGHRQLLFGQPPFSRLVLIGNKPNSDSPTSYDQHPISYKERRILEKELVHIARFFCPNSKEMTFVVYHDTVISRRIVESYTEGLGQSLIEDVLINTIRPPEYSSSTEFLRRLRFKDTPHMIQTQMPIRFKSIEDSTRMKNMPREDTWPLLDTRVMVPYLNYMIKSLLLISPHLDNVCRQGSPPKALCLGVGGGSLLKFLNSNLGFYVVGVDENIVVLIAARNFFGLRTSESLRLICGNGIHLISDLARQNEHGFYSLADYTEWRKGLFEKVNELDSTYDVIMVDLDPKDTMPVVTAPPLEFVKKSVFGAAKYLLGKHGILVINVIFSERKYYMKLIKELQGFFKQVYRIDVGADYNSVGSRGNFVRGTNCIIIAVASDAPSFSTKLMSSIPLGSIREV